MTPPVFGAGGGDGGGGGAGGGQSLPDEHDTDQSELHKPPEPPGYPPHPVVESPQPLQQQLGSAANTNADPRPA